MVIPVVTERAIEAMLERWEPPISQYLPFEWVRGEGGVETEGESEQWFVITGNGEVFCVSQ